LPDLEAKHFPPFGNQDRPLVNSAYKALVARSILLSQKATS
jgi:hypothetical protein